MECHMFWSLPSSRPKISTNGWLQWWISGLFHKPIFLGSGNLHHFFWFHGIYIARLYWNLSKVYYALGFFKRKRPTFQTLQLTNRLTWLPWRHHEVSDVIRRWWFRNPKQPPGMCKTHVKKTWGDLHIISTGFLAGFLVAINQVRIFIHQQPAFRILSGVKLGCPRKIANG